MMKLNRNWNLFAGVLALFAMAVNLYYQSGAWVVFACLNAFIGGFNLATYVYVGMLDDIREILEFWKARAK